MNIPGWPGKEATGCANRKCRQTGRGTRRQLRSGRDSDFQDRRVMAYGASTPAGKKYAWSQRLSEHRRDVSDNAGRGARSAFGAVVPAWSRSVYQSCPPDGFRRARKLPRSPTERYRYRVLMLVPRRVCRRRGVVLVLRRSFRRSVRGPAATTS